MTPAVSFGSQEFLALPKNQQNELIFSLLAPLARFDFGREVEWLKNKKDEVHQRLEMIERMLEAEQGGVGAGSALPIPVVPPAMQVPRSREPVPTPSPSMPNCLGSKTRAHPPLVRQQTIHGFSHTDFTRDSSTASSSLNDGEEEEEQDEMSAAIIRSRKINKKVVLNVGGVKHEVMWRMLERQPRSRLGLLAISTTQSQILELCDAFSLEENEYYFDRHPRTFNCILNFYRTGKLHVMEELCVMDFCQDLDYWMIDDIYLEPCCEAKYTGRKEHVVEEVKKNSKVNKFVVDDENFGNGPCARYQKCLWDLMEKPNSSFFAKCLSLFSISLVLISTLGMCLNTMPEFKFKDLEGNPVDNPHFALVEAICISWFTIEYFLRLAGAPDKWQFLKGPLNVIDVLAILPYYLSLILMDEETIGILPPVVSLNTSHIITTTTTTTTPAMLEREAEDMEFEDMSRIIQVFRIARIMRIFKLARSSSGLQAIAHTMKSSYKELSLLLLFVGMGMLIFGSLAYFVEKDYTDSKYTSIPESMWWAIQTMTSVGYGDLMPVTPLGKLVGSCCGVSGVLVMALPIPIVVENFGAYYMEQKKREVISKKKLVNEEARKENDASKTMERNNLVNILQSRPGPFTTTPESPVEGLHGSAALTGKAADIIQ